MELVDTLEKLLSDANSLSKMDSSIQTINLLTSTYKSALIKLDEMDGFSRLLHFWYISSTETKLIIVNIFNNLLQLQEPSIDQMEQFDFAFLDSLFQFIESIKQVDKESLKLVLTLFNIFQFKKKARMIAVNPVLSVLITRFTSHSSVSVFTEAFLFTLNRTDELNLMLEFLLATFTSETLQDLFYTNDLPVIFDIITREIARADNLKLVEQLLLVAEPLTRICVRKDVVGKGKLREFHGLIHSIVITSFTTTRLLEYLGPLLAE